MTDKEWDQTMAEIKSLRFQLTRIIMPAAEREELATRLRTMLYRLARRDQP